MRIVERPEIEGALAGLDVLPLIEEGFVAYSEGRAVVPPVGELILEEGETHIKYGFIRGDPWYVVRTAAAGAIGARYLAPARVERIGVAGTGVQARLQVRHLKPVTPCRAVLAWGRHPERRDAYRRDMAAQGFEVEVTADPAELGATCNLIVTTTPASEPFLRRDDIRPGTHINAIGSDAPHKQELDPGILARADLVVADSRSQCRSRGEIARALDAGAIAPERVSELGEVIAGRASRRTAEDQITVFDSTGVAVQDIQIASAIARAVGVTPRSNP
jgi:ornithine cyclodeaminase